MRRLDLHPRKKLRNPERHMRAFRQWAEAMHGWYPGSEWSGEPYAEVKLPMAEKAVSLRHARPEDRREVVVTLVDLATQISQARPANAEASRAYAMIDWPELFGSRVGVFCDLGYAEIFDPAHADDHLPWSYDSETWVEDAAKAPQDRDLFAELEIHLPASFATGGIVQRCHDREGGTKWQFETWVMMEEMAA